MMTTTQPALTVPDYPDAWGEWTDLPDGGRARVKLERDELHDLTEDGDWFGKLESAERDRQRPAGFDGSARKIRGRDTWWWQPPEDAKNDPKACRKLYNRVRSYIMGDWTYIGVIVEREGPPCPCCGERKSDYASVWGVESDAGEYLAEVAADVLADL